MVFWRHLRIWVLEVGVPEFWGLLLGGVCWNLDFSIMVCVIGCRFCSIVEFSGILFLIDL